MRGSEGCVEMHGNFANVAFAVASVVAAARVGWGQTTPHPVGPPGRVVTPIRVVPIPEPKAAPIPQAPRTPAPTLPEIASPDWPAGAPPTVAAEPPLSLGQLCDIAQGTNPGLQAAAAEVEAAWGRAQQAGLYPNPIANLGSPQWAGSDSQYFAMLNQEIVTMWKLRLNRRAASREAQQAEFAFVSRRFELLTAVRQRYANVLAGQRRIEVLEGLVDIARKSQESVAKAERGGETTRGDVLLLEIETQRAEVALQNANAILAAAREQLAATLGAPNLAIPMVTGDLKIEFMRYEDDDFRASLIDQNALLQIAGLEIDKNRVLLRRARVEPFPNVIVGAGFQYSLTPLNNQALFQLTFPIPVLNRNQGAIRAAAANVGKAASTRNQVELDLLNAVAGSLGQYEASVQQVRRYETEILPKARDALEISRKAFAQGQFDFLRLLQSQRALVEADLGYVNAQEQRWLTAAEIAGVLQLEQFP